MRYFLLGLGILFLTMPFVSANADNSAILAIRAEGIIDPSLANFIASSVDRAEKENAPALIIQLNTPGGLDTSMREITTRILSAKIPVIVYVSPSGARAASAGVFITLAGHAAAMAPGTNIGAAHPVDLMGQKVSEKIVNDAAAYIRSIAEERGRNAGWAERAVRKSVSVTEKEALKLGIIDFVARDIPDLLSRLPSKKITVGEKAVRIDVQNVRYREMPWGWQALHAISNPNVAYILMILGFYGIIYEFFNPGAILPGVFGVILLLLSFFALASLPINLVGILLIIFALILFIADIKIPGHGVLSVGGVISLIIGSYMLFPSTLPAMRVSGWLIILTAVLTFAFFTFAVAAGIRAQKEKVTGGTEELAGQVGIAKTDLAPAGLVYVLGEEWQAASLSGKINAGEKIRVTSLEGLRLNVKKEE